MSDKQIKDTGIVIALIFLILSLWGNKYFLFISGLLLLITVLLPKILYPLAFIWFKIIKIFEFIAPKIFFSLIFFLIITPIGLIKRIFTGEMLQLSDWKRSTSAFFDRNHCFTKKDLENPY